MTPSVHYLPDFPSEHLGNIRPLAVYLPPGYGGDPGRRYPVLYLQDGQNLFDPATAFGGVPWQADETAERLIRAGTIEPLMLVGVGNTDRRLDEYGPKADDRSPPGPSFPFARFMVEEVKPVIDRMYATKPEPRHTTVGGSSMGGLISLWLAHWYPDVFGKCAALSPSLWWDDELVLREFRDHPEGLRKVRFWIDTGTNEGGNPQACQAQVRRTRRLAKLLSTAGLRRGREFKYREVAGAEHNEHAWAARFHEVLGFFFRRERGPSGRSDFV
jgi:predicted alpha/beta superfamily hydrolase